MRKFLLTSIFFTFLLPMHFNYGKVSSESKLTRSYARVLRSFVNFKGMVNYRALISPQNQKTLEQASRAFSFVKTSTYKKWSSNRKIAFLVNAYNLFTIQLIVKHYPTSSIRKIPGAFKKKFITLLEQKISLDDLENQILRRDFKEPRIHFALVCAAMSCPILKREPYSSQRLNQQLNEQTLEFLKSSKNYRLNKNKKTLWLSSIFKWFGDDFKNWKRKFISSKDEAIIHFLMDYIPKNHRKFLQKNKITIKHLYYNWKLNRQN